MKSAPEWLDKYIRNRTISITSTELKSKEIIDIFCTINERSLTTLILMNAKIGHEKVHNITNGLQTTQSLNTLNLAENYIGDKSAKRIIVAINKNQSLRELILRSNNIGPNGARFIAEEIKYNQSITYLNLCNNYLRKGIEAISNSIVRYNATIQSLNHDNDNDNQLKTVLTQNTNIAEVNSNEKLEEAKTARINSMMDAGCPQEQAKKIVEHTASKNPYFSHSKYTPGDSDFINNDKEDWTNKFTSDSLSLNSKNILMLSRLLKRTDNVNLNSRMDTTKSIEHSNLSSTSSTKFGAGSK